jgi:hypothetical protein
MRAAVDLLGALLLGISGAALLVVAVLAVVGFVGNQTGIALLFSALTVVCLPLVAFAAWRAFRPLWLLSRELNGLRTREQELIAEVNLAVGVRPGQRGARVRPPPQARPTGREARAAQKALPGRRSATGWRPPPPRTSVNSVLSTRQVSWRVVVAIGVIMLLFAAGLLAGVLVRR